MPLGQSWWLYASLLSLVSGLLALSLFLLNRVRRTFLRFAHKNRKRISFGQNTFRFLAILFWIAISSAAFFFAAFVQSYQSFTREELVAQVKCYPLKDSQTMQFEIESRPQDVRKRFVLKGDQWAVEGDILKWDSWLNFVGLHSMYKLTRVRGRFLATDDEIHRVPSVYSLVQQEREPIWRLLYKYGHKLPFVSAVYGNTVFTYPSEEHEFEIYVTTSGYIARVKDHR